MAAQKRETGKNYIELLHEETEEQRVAELSPTATYPFWSRYSAWWPRCSTAAAKRGSYPRPAAALSRRTGQWPGPQGRSLEVALPLEVTLRAELE
jgi:hypothetical protein